MSNKIRVLLEVEIDNSTGWLGLDDYKEMEGINTNLDVFNFMTNDEFETPLNTLVNLSGKNTKSRFVGVSEDDDSPMVARANQLEQAASDLLASIQKQNQHRSPQVKCFMTLTAKDKKAFDKAIEKASLSHSQL